MQKANFACEFCGDDKSTLHIHHLEYVGEPWDAPDEALECLCEFHHTQRESETGLILCFAFKKGRAEEGKRLVDAIANARERGVSRATIVTALNALPKDEADS